MELQDKVLPCVDCGDKFVFRKEEQIYFIDRGYPEPKRCFDCRRKKRKRKRKAIKKMMNSLKTAENVDIKLVNAGSDEKLPLMKSRSMTTRSIVREGVTVGETATVKTEKVKNSSKKK